MHETQTTGLARPLLLRYLMQPVASIDFALPPSATEAVEANADEESVSEESNRGVPTAEEFLAILDPTRFST